MKKRILCILAAMAMLLVCFAGCGGDTKDPQKNPNSDPTTENKAQLVVALNPILDFDDGSSVVIFNEVNKAMKADNETSSLSAMYQDTTCQWVYQTATGWKQRATYNLTRWTNGAGATAKKTAAYTFNEAGDISLSRYASSSLELTTYDGTAVPQVGLLLSATGGEQEALCYSVTQDGKLSIPAGEVTAISEVAGVKTGFLAEDGTSRSAALSIMLNNKQIWSGTLANSTAAEDGIAITTLQYPDLDDLEVTSGDRIFFTMKLDAQANADDDVSKPAKGSQSYSKTVSSWTERVEITPTNGATTTTNRVDMSDVVNKGGSISMFTNYMFTFKLVRAAENRLLVADMANTLMKNTKAVITIAKEDDEPGEFEIVVGRHDKYPDSITLADALKNSRPDSAMDYSLVLIGTRLYISAVTDVGLERAVDYFIETFGQNDKGSIPADYSYVKQDSHETYFIGNQNIGSFTAIRVEKYPNYMTLQAARDIQNMIQDKAGYKIDIIKGTDGMDSAVNEFRIGGMKDRVAVDRKYNTHFTVADTDNPATANELSHIYTDGLMDGVADSYYQINFSGTNLIANGGSNYAINAGVQVMLNTLYRNHSIPAGYTLSGDYVSQIAYWNPSVVDDNGYDTRYDTVKYELSDGYGLVFSEEFNMLGSHEETEKDITGRWSVSKDGTNPKEDAASKALEEKHGFDVGQLRPGVYGTNWWVQQDETGNGYLLQITRYNAEASGTPNGEEAYRNHTLTWDAGRVIGANKWAFRYGIQEVRMVMGTRNGSCSAVWSAGGAPISGGAHNEIDTYENFGQDIVVPNLHTWDSSINASGHIDHNGNGDMEHAKLFANGTTTAPAEKSAPDKTDSNEHFYNTFHTVGIVWDADNLDFYLDGEIYCEVDITPTIMNAFREGTNMKLANGIGVGGYTGGWDPWDFLDDGAFTLNNGQPNEYKDAAAKYDFYLDKLENFFEVQYVDYVHIYQTNPKDKNARNCAKFYTSNTFG